MQLDDHSEIERALLSMDYDRRASLLVCSLCRGDDGRDLGDAIFGLLSCASALSSRLDDPLLRAIICRRLSDMIDNLADEGFASVSLH